MTTHELTTSSTAALRLQLDLLGREWAAAALEGLDGNRLYMEDLLHELQTVRAAYVGAAVTEIASLRSALDGPLHG